MDAMRIAEAVRGACVRVALDAHEDAGVRGLCEAGRWECAVQALRGLDLGGVLAAAAADRSRADP
jgi:hypothetical protein